MNCKCPRREQSALDFVVSCRTHLQPAGRSEQLAPTAAGAMRRRGLCSLSAGQSGGGAVWMLMVLVYTISRSLRTVVHLVLGRAVSLLQRGRGAQAMP